MPVTIMPTALRFKKEGGAFASADCIKGDKGDPGQGLPEVSAADNGKVMKVVNGEWAAAEIPNAEGVDF